MIADGQLIAALQMTFDNADAVNANAVGAAQIAHDQVIPDLSDAAMPAGDLGRFELDVTFRIAAQKQDGFIQQNAGSAADGLELRRHGDSPIHPAIAGNCRTSASYIRPQRGAIGKWPGEGTILKTGQTN